MSLTDIYRVSTSIQSLAASVSRHCHPDPSTCNMLIILIAATTVPRTLEKDDEALGVKAGEKGFYYPIVDARKGLLKTSAGRMSATGSQAKEHDGYNNDPYENYGRLNAV